MPRRLNIHHPGKGKTTIQVSRDVADGLREAGKMGEDYNDVIRRLLTGECLIWVDVLQVDGEPPESHTVLFQLGNEPPRYYRYSYGVVNEIPKPKIVIKEGKKDAKNSSRARPK